MTDLDPNVAVREENAPTSTALERRVELGDARDATYGHVHAGDMHFDQAPPTSERGPDSRVARARGVLRGYLDLRRTPYGLTPAVIFGLITFFQVFDSQAFSVAGPEL